MPKELDNHTNIHHSTRLGDLKIKCGAKSRWERCCAGERASSHAPHDFMWPKYLYYIVNIILLFCKYCPSCWEIWLSDENVWFIYVCTCSSCIPGHRIYPVGIQGNESLWRLNVPFGGWWNGRMVSGAYLPAVGTVPGSDPQNVNYCIYPNYTNLS